MNLPPSRIDNFAVLEYGVLPNAILPSGYLPPRDGGRALEPMQNFAVCKADGVDGFYLLCCTPDWRYMTYAFSEDKDDLKSQILVEFNTKFGQWYPFIQQ